MRLKGFTNTKRKLKAVDNLPAIRDWLNMYYGIELDEYGSGMVDKITIRYLSRCGELQVGDDNFDRWANSVDTVFDVWLNKGMREFDIWLKEKQGEVK